MKKWVVNVNKAIFSRATEYWLGFRSRLRWFLSYLLPMGISWPFKNSLFTGLILLLIALSFLSLLLQFPFAAKLLASIKGFAVVNWGQEAWDLIALILGPWAFLTLSISYAANVFWAGQRRVFFERVRNAGLHIVRGGGRRMPFLERMCSENKVILGRGETGRILPDYVEIKEEENIYERLGGARSVIIAAPSTAGKTRTALELAYKLHPDIVIVWPQGVKVEGNQFANLPKIRGDFLVFVDDISLSVGEGKPSLFPSLLELKRASADMRLIATKRLEELPKELAGAEICELSEDSPERYLPLVKRIAKEEGVPQEEVQARFAGHPGSIVANLDAKRQHWKAMPIGCQRIMQAEKIMWMEGMRNIDVSRLLAALEDLWVIKAEDSNIDVYLENLEEQGFITRSGDEIRSYGGYRDKVVLLPNAPQNAAERVIDGLVQRRDADSLMEIGSSLREEYSPQYQSGPRHLLRKALMIYKWVLGFITNESKIFSAVHVSLGSTYRNLAAHEDPIPNLRAAVAAFRQAEPFNTEEIAPLDYAMIQNNLGNTFGDIAVHEAPVANLKDAIAAFLQALRFYTVEVAPLNFAMVQNNLAVAYGNLAAYENPVANLKAGATALHQALRFYTEEKAPLRFAAIQNNLGITHKILASYEDSVLNLKAGIAACQQALRFYTEEVAPLNFAMTQHNLGNVYRVLSEHQEPVRNLTASIASFHQALRFFTEESAPFDFAMTQSNLGIAYLGLAVHQDPVPNLKAAVAACQQALRFRTEESTPLKFAATKKNLAMAYEALAEYENSDINQQLANDAREQAKRALKKD